MSGHTPTFSEWKYPLVILCAVVLVYVQTLSFDFVNYDDPDLVTNNAEFLGNPLNAATAFTTHAFTSHREESAYYRPLLLVSFIADYQIWQLNPIGFHLTNLLIHAAAAVLLFLLLRKVARDELVALAGSLLFALHPVQTESVAWIAGRNDALVGLFVIMMVYFYVPENDRKAPGRRELGLSALSFLLALFTKESAAFFIVLPAIYDIVVRRAPIRSLAAPPRRLYYAALAGSLGAYFLIRLALFGEFIGAERLYGVIDPGTRLTMVPAMLVEHLGLLVAPVALCVVHPLADIRWLNDPWTYAAYAVLVLCAVALWWTWKNERTACFGLLWLAAGFVPVLNIFPVAVPILEHRLYTSIAGFSLALASVLRRRLPADGRIFGIVMGALLLAAAAGSFLRTPVWRSSEPLWTDAIAKAPDASRAYFNLAGFYFEKQQYDKTVDLMDAYVRLKPEDLMGYVKLRQTLLLARKYPEANAVSRRMIALNPHNPNRYIEAGMLYERFNMPDSAIGIYLQGIAVDTSFYQLHARLGTVYDALGYRDRATRYYLDAIRLIEEGAKNFHPPSETIALLKYLYEQTGQTEKAKTLASP